MQKGIRESDTRVEAAISVFVSRFDRLLDDKLAKSGVAKAKVGNLNAANIYNTIEAANEPNIRTLFASTGVKGDELRPDYYIRELLAKHSVNTAPLATIESYIEEPLSSAELPIAVAEIDAYFLEVKRAGIDMQSVYNLLLKDGLEAFEKAFEDMLESIK